MLFLLSIGGLQLSLPANAQQNKGIQFFEGSWAQALAKSKETGKPIFVDVYTSWCGPCKMMDKEIFPLEQVGQKYNGAFINYKADAEKGDGVAIAGKYNVRSFPTYLFVSSEGELFHRSVGFNADPKFFIADADAALKAALDPYGVSKMTADFKKGKRDVAFLKAYIVKLKQLEINNSEAMDAYLLKLGKAEGLQAENFNFFMNQLNSAASASFDFVMQNMDKVAEQADGKTGMAKQNLARLLQEALTTAMSAAKYKEAGKLIAYASKLKGMNDYHRDFFDTQKLEYLEKTNQVAEMLKAAKLYVKEDTLLAVAHVRQENKRRLDVFMGPYLTGERDSIAESSFQKLKDFYSTQYLVAVSFRLHTAAKYINSKVKTRAELISALEWNRKAEQLLPNEKAYRELSAKILNKIGAK